MLSAGHCARDRQLVAVGIRDIFRIEDIQVRGGARRNVEDRLRHNSRHVVRREVDGDGGGVGNRAVIVPDVVGKRVAGKSAGLEPRVRRVLQRSGVLGPRQ